MAFKDKIVDEEPIQISGFLSEYERKKILDIFYEKEAEWHIKGAMTRVRYPETIPYIRDYIIPKAQEVVGPCVCIGDNIYKTTQPYTIHTDAKYGKDYIKGLVPFRQVVLPLEVDKDLKTKFFLFNQRYYDDAAHFVNGIPEELAPNPMYNSVITDSYKNHNVENLETTEKISKEWWEENINRPHMPYSAFEGLSVSHELDWEVGSLMTFNSWQLHCSHNFRLIGADYKIGLVLVLMKEENAENINNSR